MTKNHKKKIIDIFFSIFVMSMIAGTPVFSAIGGLATAAHTAIKNAKLRKQFLETGISTMGVLTPQQQYNDKVGSTRKILRTGHYLYIIKERTANQQYYPPYIGNVHLPKTPGIVKTPFLMGCTSPEIFPDQVVLDNPTIYNISLTSSDWTSRHLLNDLNISGETPTMMTVEVQRLGKDFYKFEDCNGALIIGNSKKAIINHILPNPMSACVLGMMVGICLDVCIFISHI